MLENRSFDCLFGKLYPKSDAFDGLAGHESNTDGSGAPIEVWNGPGTDFATMSIPTPDPGELFDSMNMQIFGQTNPQVGVPATMSGFVKDYQAQNAGNDPRAVMHYFSPEQVPVMSRLARQFAVCDRWHAS